MVCSPKDSIDVTVLCSGPRRSMWWQLTATISEQLVGDMEMLREPDGAKLALGFRGLLKVSGLPILHRSYTLPSFCCLALFVY